MALVKTRKIDAYKDTEIQTANQGKLIVMLYEGAGRFIKLAIENMSHESYDIVNTNIIKAQDIITELMLSLNMTEGGEISHNLFNLYAYMKKRLLEANIQKEAAILEEIMGMLGQLMEAWKKVAQKEGNNQGLVGAEKIKEGSGFSIQG